MLNPLERFLERVHNQPEHAAHFAKKIAGDMSDSLGNHYGRRFSIRHGREVASLRHWEKSKVGSALSVRRLASYLRFCMTASALLPRASTAAVFYLPTSLDRGGQRPRLQVFGKAAHAFA